VDGLGTVSEAGVIRVWQDEGVQGVGLFILDEGRVLEGVRLLTRGLILEWVKVNEDGLPDRNLARAGHDRPGAPGDGHKALPGPHGRQTEGSDEGDYTGRFPRLTPLPSPFFP